MNRLARALVRELPVRRVFAFGSFARRDMHECSDLDLLLVGDFDRPPRLRERAVRELAWRLGIDTPLDVVTCAPEDLEAPSLRPFLAHVLEEAVEVLAVIEGDGGFSGSRQPA